MTDSAEALLGRFRANLRQRAEAAHELLEGLRADSSREDLKQQALGELHTLKGEARVLALDELASLAHAIEELFAAEQGAPSEATLNKASGAIEGIIVTLGQELPAAAVRTVFMGLIGELGGVATAGEVAGSEPSARQSQVPDGGTTQKLPDPASPIRRFAQVDAASIDALCERVAELAAAFGKLHARTVAMFGGGNQRSGPGAAVFEEFEKCRTLIDGTTSDAWTLRLSSVAPTLKELGRNAARTAASLGKALDVQVQAGEVQLERDVLALLWDSLLHLVQNSVDHGLELPEERGNKPKRGTLKLMAQSEGSSVVLTVEDDGRGIDAAVVRNAAVARGVASRDSVSRASEGELMELLFGHGFSTRDRASELSGRGVGLDVVRRRVESLGGRVAVESAPGKGTRFSLTVPFAITKERLLIVKVCDGLFALPSRLVLAVLGASDLRNAKAADADVLRYAGDNLPLRSLSKALGLGDKTSEPFTLVVTLGGARWALSVPELVGEHELVRRPAGALLASSGVIGASAMLEDGRMALLLDLNTLTRVLRQSGQVHSGAEPPRQTRRRDRVLAVDDSPVIGTLVTEILTGAGLDVRVVNEPTLAMAAIEAYQPDLVLSDVEMPNMDGFQLVAEIRRKSQRLPVVMFTTRGSAEDRRRAAEAGANAYLVKTDFQSEALIDTVRRFLPISS